MESLVDAIRKAVGRRSTPFSAPRLLLLAVAYLIEAVARPLGIHQPLSPVRVRKTYRSTFVDPKRLRELGYEWKFTLEEALRDWKQDRPEDFSA